MREIKFRAWDERKLIMHYDFEFVRSGVNDNGWIVFKSDLQPLEATPHPFENPHFEQQLKIMQFTGLKDKNGTEIYEGDIIDYGNNRHYPITYEVNGFGIKFINGHERNWLDLTKFEVIGNIYQHPELL